MMKVIIIYLSGVEIEWMVDKVTETHDCVQKQENFPFSVASVSYMSGTVCPLVLNHP